jgi:hypothetical protein
LEAPERADVEVRLLEITQDEELALARTADSPYLSIIYQTFIPMNLFP